MYFKQKCYLNLFLSSRAKYALRVVNMAADRPFWTISTFPRVQIKLDIKKYTNNVFQTKVLS